MKYCEYFVRSPIWWKIHWYSQDVKSCPVQRRSWCNTLKWYRFFFRIHSIMTCEKQCEQLCNDLVLPINEGLKILYLKSGRSKYRTYSGRHCSRCHRWESLGRIFLWSITEAFLFFRWDVASVSLDLWRYLANNYISSLLIPLIKLSEMSNQIKWTFSAFQ